MGLISIPCPNSNIRVRWIGLETKKLVWEFVATIAQNVAASNPICCHYYFIMGPSIPFFLVSLHCVSSCICRTLPFACHIGACWCLTSCHYYFTSFCCCYCPWRCYYCFLSSCWYFPSMHRCYFPSCCYYCFFLHCNFCIVAFCKGKTGQKKSRQYFWYWLHLRPLANLTFSPLTPIPSLNEVYKVMKIS